MLVDVEVKGAVFYMWWGSCHRAVTEEERAAGLSHTGWIYTHNRYDAVGGGGGQVSVLSLLSSGPPSPPSPHSAQLGAGGPIIELSVETLYTPGFILPAPVNVELLAGVPGKHINRMWRSAWQINGKAWIKMAPDALLPIALYLWLSPFQVGTYSTKAGISNNYCATNSGWPAVELRLCRLII